MAEWLISALTDFYRLDFDELFWLMAVATGCFLKVHERFRQKRWWKAVLAAVLLLAAAVTVYSTLGSRNGGYTGELQLVPFHSYREIRNGGNPEIYRSNLMNVVLFYPIGLLLAALLPEKWPKWRKAVLPTLLLVLLSVGIEYAQYRWQLGKVEIDDVIHNSLGALLGSLCSLIPLPRKRS